jgi:hypothetical protein
MFRQAVEGREKALGQEHAGTLEAVNGLGLSLYEQKYEVAVSMFRRVDEGQEKVLGQEHSDINGFRLLA